jgi:hypothetical protein
METPQTKRHAGGCHCGKVRYEVTGAFDAPMGCNCSMCSKKGTLLAFVPEDAFELTSGADELTDYQFNKHVIHHTFCRTCGVTSFARGTRRDGSKMVAVNVRCLDGFDLGAVKVQHVDGKSF